MNFTLDTLAKGIKNPTDAFYFIYSRVDKKVESYFYTVNNALTSDVFSDGVSMMERDWDNLIILDACRYDNFSAINTLSGTLEKEISKGSSSSEFIEKNFSRGNFHDTIYVSANPFANELQNDTFYLKKLATELWDYELNTVHPSDLRELGSVYIKSIRTND